MITATNRYQLPTNEEVYTQRGVYHLEGGFAFISFWDDNLGTVHSYIHPDADLNELDYYCQDPGLRTVLELDYTIRYGGAACLLGARPLQTTIEGEPNALGK